MKWKKESSFTSNHDGVKIAYASLLHDSNDIKATIVFFTGYKETYEKYLSFLSTLHTKGNFNIFTMDHRNQGMSDDTPGTTYETGFDDSSGKRICYVKDFESTYIQDARQFIETIVKPSCEDNDSSIFAIGHSMGGLICTRLAEITGSTLVDGMVLSAPMISHKNILNVGGLFDLELPIGFAKSFGKFMVYMNQGPVKADGRDTNASLPTTEKLTHCEEKSKAWNKLRAERPEIVLGGASFQWAKAAIDIEDIVMNDAHKIEIPSIMFMAEHDVFVYNSAISALAEKMDQEKTLVVGPISNAYHELFQETDEISTSVLNSICAFASEEPSTLKKGFPESVLSTIKTIPVTESQLDKPPYCAVM